jgi:outer membrane receptor protein involved in Fe transport
MAGWTGRNSALSLMVGVAGAALLMPAAALAADAATPADTSKVTVVDDIVVTATKRSEPVREISGSVSAFDENRLETLGAETLGDYLTRTPGVVFNQSVPGNSPAIIRGVATTTGIAQAQGTTGYFINDVPLTDPFYSGGIPDIDTFDVGNVAVLRGPQGTLFGSSSMGGAINYQARKPDLNQVDARVRGTVSDTRHGDESYSGQVMLNLPVVKDVFAVRGVFTRRRDGGYVDNVGTGATNSNRTDVTGGRLMATFTPAAGTEINFLFLDQIEQTDDQGATQPTAGPYAKDTRIAEPFKYRTTIYNLRLDQDLGFATLTATATHHAKRFSSQQDYSGLVPPFAPAAFIEPGTSTGDTFEARIASPAGQRFEYLFGVFHDSTNESVTDQLLAPAATSALGTADLIDANVAIRGHESAAFGEATYHFTDTLKATVGGRLFRTDLTTITQQSGPLSGGSSLTAGTSKETGFSPKASITWQPDQAVLVYGLVSKGFRFGGPNIAVDPTFPIPKQFDSDSLINYELGARTDWFDHRLQLDGTLFFVDWNNIQVSQRSPGGFIYTGNAGKAFNSGFEGNATFHATPALTFQGGVTYLDAELRRDFGAGATFVPRGTRLPGASRWQVSDSVVYSWADLPAQPSLAFSHRYISSAPGELTPAPRMQGGYNLFDLRLSATFGKVGVTGFIENIGDARGISEAVTGVNGPVEYLVRPRTIGVTFDYRL